MGTDTAFLDRMHCYIPGWEIPKFRPEHFTNDWGFITDYLAEFLRELRKEQFGDALDQYYHLGRNLNQRDTIAVRRMVGGFIKLLYPDGVYTKEELEEILVLALEMRRRVKEQLKKLGGMEFYDVNFSYIDNETFEEHFVSVPEQGGGKLIPDGVCNPGNVYTISQGKSGMIGVYRLESQMLPGNGKFERTGLSSDQKAKESTNTAFNFLKANSNHISGTISTTQKDYIIGYQDLQGIGMTNQLALPTLIALCSIALNKPTLSNLAVLGEISISGTILKVNELANALQAPHDSWDNDFIRKWLLLPPFLGDVDLRPMIYLSKDKSTLLTVYDDLSPEGRKILEALKAVKNGPSNKELISKIKGLGEIEATILLNQVARIGRSNNTWTADTVCAAIHIIIC